MQAPSLKLQSPTQSTRKITCIIILGPPCLDPQLLQLADGACAQQSLPALQDLQSDRGGDSLEKVEKAAVTPHVADDAYPSHPALANFDDNMTLAQLGNKDGKFVPNEQTLQAAHDMLATHHQALEAQGIPRSSKAVGRDPLPPLESHELKPPAPSQELTPPSGSEGSASESVMPTASPAAEQVETATAETLAPTVTADSAEALAPPREERVVPTAPADIDVPTEAGQVNTATAKTATPTSAEAKVTPTMEMALDLLPPPTEKTSSPEGRGSESVIPTAHGDTEVPTAGGKVNTATAETATPTSTELMVTQTSETASNVLVTATEAPKGIFGNVSDSDDFTLFTMCANAYNQMSLPHGVGRGFGDMERLLRSMGVKPNMVSIRICVQLASPTSHNTECFLKTFSCMPRFPWSSFPTSAKKTQTHLTYSAK